MSRLSNHPPTVISLPTTICSRMGAPRPQPGVDPLQRKLGSRFSRRRRGRQKVSPALHEQLRCQKNRRPPKRRTANRRCDLSRHDLWIQSPVWLGRVPVAWRPGARVLLARAQPGWYELAPPTPHCDPSPLHQDFQPSAQLRVTRLRPANRQYHGRVAPTRRPCLRDAVVPVLLRGARLSTRETVTNP